MVNEAFYAIAGTLESPRGGRDRSIVGLFRALLDSACEDLAYEHDATRPDDLADQHALKLYNDAVDWISGYPVTRGYTFDFVCTYLGIDTAAAQKALLRNKQTHPVSLRTRPARPSRKMELPRHGRHQSTHAH